MPEKKKSSRNPSRNPEKNSSQKPSEKPSEKQQQFDIKKQCLFCQKPTKKCHCKTSKDHKGLFKSWGIEWPPGKSDKSRKKSKVKVESERKQGGPGQRGKRKEDNYSQQSF